MRPRRSRWSQGWGPRETWTSKARTGLRAGHTRRRRWNAYGKQQGNGRRRSFTALLHHVSIDLLRELFLALKRNASPGVDGLTWRAYQADLDRNLTDLHGRLHRGAYRALPSRRTYIPKADGRQFALTLHPEKTRLIEFGRFAAERRKRCGLGKPETFKFLGFVFICARSRRGRFIVKRKSRGDRQRAKLKEIKEELRRRMHQPIPEQGAWLAQVVRGYFAYHAVPTNVSALNAFLHYVKRIWMRALRRRGQKHRVTWARIARMAGDLLPKPKILHPWPHQRFTVKYPRREPDALIGHVRICAGGAQ